MTDYITKPQPEKPNKITVIKDAIEKITGNVPIRIQHKNGKVIGLSIDDNKLSAPKKKELQNYIDTLEK